MNNFETHERATTLSDTMTPYALARRIIELEESAKEVRLDAVREARIFLFRSGFNYGAPYALENLISQIERGEL